MSYEEKLFHDNKAFMRETLSERMQKYGFKNMGRLELFLWDLEIFLQIQSILGDRIVLKGGAAVQFYLPMEAQRTSVDIDMIFFGSKAEIEETLEKFTEKLSENDVYFHFKPHKPKEPKTDLPLYTYYTKIPTVLTQGELNKGGSDEQSEFQEIKIEFIQEDRKAEYIKKTGTSETFQKFICRTNYHVTVFFFNIISHMKKIASDKTIKSAMKDTVNPFVKVEL